MDLRLLIDGLVRQTTVLIAQLSTSAGVRAPLSHVADQVFMELAQEIEAQGVKRRVVADMFGMALRAYQKKMQRLAASASQPDRSLWEAVLDYLARGEVSRAQIERRFSHDGKPEVAAVLRDLVRSGLAYATGSGEGAVYGLTNDDVRDRVQRSADTDAVANVAWLKIFRGEVATAEQLFTAMPATPALVRAALDQLVKSGRVEEHADGRLVSSNVVLPVGAEQGFEAALLDHFRAVSVALATKVRAGGRGAAADDRTGGSTFTFTLADGHPHAAEVLGLLAETRARTQALWDRVASHNEAHPPDEDASRVTFYLGQVVEERDERDERSHGGDDA